MCARKQRQHENESLELFTKTWDDRDSRNDYAKEKLFWVNQWNKVGYKWMEMLDKENSFD